MASLVISPAHAGRPKPWQVLWAHVVCHTATQCMDAATAQDETLAGSSALCPTLDQRARKTGKLSLGRHAPDVIRRCSCERTS